MFLRVWTWHQRLSIRFASRWSKSGRDAASTVRWLHEERPGFQTSLIFLRAHDLWSGARRGVLISRRYPTYTARSTTHGWAEIWPDPKNSHTTGQLAQNEPTVAQCMHSFSGGSVARQHVSRPLTLGSMWLVYLPLKMFESGNMLCGVEYWVSCKVVLKGNIKCT